MILKVVNIFEEGFKGLLGKLKRSFTKSGRAANVNDKHLEGIRKAMVNEFNAEEDLNELKAYKQWVQDCITSSEESLKDTEDKNLKSVIQYHIDWMTKFLKDVDKKINSVQAAQESFEVDGEYLEEGLKDVIGKVKGLFNKQARIEKKELKKINNEIEQSKRSFTLALHECNYKQCEVFKVEIQNLISKYKGLMENDPMEERVKLMESYCEWLGKFIREIEAKMKTLQESLYEFDDCMDYVEEGFKDFIAKMKRGFSKEGRELNQYEKFLDKGKKAMEKELKSADLEKCNQMKEGIEHAIANNKELLPNEDDANVKQVMQKHTDWMEGFLVKINDRISSLQ